MQDTISYNSDGGAHQTSNAWYVRPNEDGKNVYSLIYNTNCMGYENLYGDKYEWLSGVSLPNTNAQEQYKLLIEMPDGSTRKVKSGTVDGYCTGMYHQKYMDVVGVNSQKGSSTTYYCDILHHQVQQTVWCAGRSATRMRLAVFRTRFAATIPRPRIRVSARVSESIRRK